MVGIEGLASLAVVLFVIVITLIAIPMMAPMRCRGPDAEVKANLKNAATAQEAYFVDHDTYTSNIDSLKGYGYHQRYYVTMGTSATTTTYVITGTATKGCKENTGTWSINSIDGSISATPCSCSR